MFIAQSEVIREIAANQSCVIIGRAADYILRNEPHLVRVHIRANKEDRIMQAVANYELPRKGAENYVKKADRSRANYYRFYTGRVWGDPENADLVINTSFTGFDGAVELIKQLLKLKGYID